MFTFLRARARKAALLRGLRPLAAAVGAALLLAAAPAASAGPRYAAAVMDAESGELIYANNADSRRRPASITKVMTLYLTFEALESGRLKLDDRLTVSSRAAAQPASRLGLAAGATITVEQAINALAVKSANDVAVVLAEELGGDEPRFAEMMTRKARALGLKNTTYANASGLPDERQVTTARDIAALSRATIRDFPQYYGYFGKKSWTHGGQSLRNHNGLLFRRPEVDGIKTGFINASGFNLTASAVRDGRRLIVVVLGGDTSRSRDDHVSALLDVGFDVLELRDKGLPSKAAVNRFRAVELPTGEPVSALAARAGAAAAQGDGAPGEASAPADATSNGYVVQVGSFAEKALADRWLAEVTRRFGEHFKGARGAVVSSGDWWVTRYSGLSREQAQLACEAMLRRDLSCFGRQP